MNNDHAHVFRIMTFLLREIEADAAEAANQAEAASDDAYYVGRHSSLCAMFALLDKTIRKMQFETDLMSVFREFEFLLDSVNRSGRAVCAQLSSSPFDAYYTGILSTLGECSAMLKTAISQARAPAKGAA